MMCTNLEKLSTIVTDLNNYFVWKSIPDLIIIFFY